MDKYKITCGKLENGKYCIYQKEVRGKILNIKTSKGIKSIGITRHDSIFYTITDLETGFRLRNYYTTKGSKTGFEIRDIVEMKIYNYLQAYRKAKEIYESDLYDKAIINYKKVIKDFY